MWNPLKLFTKRFRLEDESWALYHQAQKLNETDDNPGVFAMYQKALDATHPEYNNYTVIVFTFAMALEEWCRFSLPVRQEAFGLFGMAFEVEEKAPSKIFPDLLLNYGRLAIYHSRVAKTTETINMVVDKYTPLVQSDAEGDREWSSIAHHIIGMALLTCQEIEGSSAVGELDEAFTYLLRALELSPPDTRARTIALQGMSKAQYRRYEIQPCEISQRDMRELWNAIQSSRKAWGIYDRSLGYNHPDIVRLKYDLAQMCLTQYIHHGKEWKDLQAAWRLANDAKELGIQLRKYGDVRDLERLIPEIKQQQAFGGTRGGPLPCHCKLIRLPTAVGCGCDRY